MRNGLREFDISLKSLINGVEFWIQNHFRDSNWSDKRIRYSLVTTLAQRGEHFFICAAVFWCDRKKFAFYLRRSSSDKLQIGMHFLDSKKLLQIKKILDSPEKFIQDERLNFRSLNLLIFKSDWFDFNWGKNFYKKIISMEDFIISV